MKGRPKGSFKKPLQSDAPKPVPMKFSIAAKIADKNSKTIVKISQLLVIIYYIIIDKISSLTI
jgi:hypothetical protein